MSENLFTYSKRFIPFIFLTGASIAGGIVADMILRTEPFPVFVGISGFVVMVLAHFPLKRTGKLLELLEQSKLAKSEGLGMHKPIYHERSLSMCKTPSPFRVRHFYDLFWPAYWVSVLFPDHYHYPVVVDSWVPILSGRAGIGRKVWRGIHSLLPTRADAHPQTVMCSPGSHQTH